MGLYEDLNNLLHNQLKDTIIGDTATFLTEFVMFFVKIGESMITLLGFIPKIFEFFIWGLQAGFNNWFVFIIFIEIYIIIKSIEQKTLTDQLYCFFNSQFLIVANVLLITEKIFSKVTNLIKSLPFT